MKVTIACFLCLVALSMAFIPNSPEVKYQPNGCLRLMGSCVSACPEGTTEYGADCGPVTPEATCDHPHPVPETDITCDFSDCYCDPPTVRDTKTKYCVKLEDCPKKE